jgi:hypothetical protein
MLTYEYLGQLLSSKLTNFGDHIIYTLDHHKDEIFDGDEASSAAALGTRWRSPSPIYISHSSSPKESADLIPQYGHALSYNSSSLS